MTDYPVFHRPPRPVFNRRPGGQTPSFVRSMTRTLADGTYGSIGVSGTGTDYYPLWEFEDIADAEAATIPSGVTRVRTRYFDDATQLGGANYKRVASQPAHDLAWQDAAGTWFEIDEQNVNICQAGAVVDGVTADTAAIQKAIDYISEKNGGKVLFPPGTTCIDDTMLIEHSHVFLEGTGPAAYRTSQLNIPATASSMIKWIGGATGPMIKFEPPNNGVRQNGGGMANLSLDGNAFLATIGVEIRSWHRGLWENVNIERCAVDHWLLGITSNTLTETPIDCRENRFVRCRASTRGGSGEYLTSAAKGFRLTGRADLGTNTCFNMFDQCSAILSVGVPYYLENCDYNIFRSCFGNAQRDSSVYGFELCSGDQDSTGNGGPARYNAIENAQSKIRARASQTGGSSSNNNYIVVNRGNGVDLPTYETASGGADEPTGVIIDSSSGGLYFDGKIVINKRIDTWETPIGPGSREVFDSSTVTLPELAARVHSLIKDLSQLRSDSHGMIGLTASASVDDADVIAGEEKDVLAISFIDGTLRIRDSATPGNDYSGSVAGKMTVTGTLTPSVDGAFFDSSNYATLATSAFGWSNSTGTILLEFMDNSFSTGTHQTGIQIDNGTTGMRHTVRVINTDDDTPEYVGVTSAVSQWTISPSGWSNYINGTVKRIGCVFSSNAVSASYEGDASSTDSAATMPTVTTLRLGVDQAGGNPANCYLRRIIIAKRKFSLAEIEDWSADP